MEKIAILTLNGNPNFGNRLQNYALQKVLRDFNFESETIINATNIPRDNRSHKQIFLEGDLHKKIKMIKTKLSVEFYKKQDQKRKIAFEAFVKKYIKEMDFSIEPGRIPHDFHKNYKYFIAGSDQVWNPNIPAVSELSFLTFAPKEKRITYAPSFGVSNIPNEYEEDYRNWLMGIEKLSVREEAGAKIIENKPKNKYILTYFLGDITKDVQQKINSIAKKNNLEIVNLAMKKHKKYYETDPSEFIDYINDASIFFTDSFHGCVFSVLLETPFVVCDRAGHSEKENMSSRIDTFVNKFNLQSRKLEKITNNDLFNCNYEETNKILEMERKEAYSYLKEILNIK